MTPSVKENILDWIATTLAGIDAGLHPDRYHNTVSRVVRGIVDPDEGEGTIVVMVASAVEIPDPSLDRRAGGGPGIGMQYRHLLVDIDTWLADEFMTDTKAVGLGCDIERAMLQDRYMDGHAVNVWWRGTTIGSVNTQGGPTALLRVQFTVQFRTLYGRPETPLAAS